MILTRRPLPKISIVTPSFNQGRFLEECLDSILSQNYPNLEYIVMDGGSSDRSTDIIRKYARHLTYWQSQPDGGQYHAIQAGFERSTGEIMAWLNSDDKLHPGALVFVAEIFRQRPDLEWILGRPTAWNEAGLLKDVSPELPRWSRENYLERQFEKGFIQQESTFWKRSLWDRAGSRLDTNLQYAADFELWARFFRTAPLQTVDAMLGGFRFHSAQKTAHLMREYQAEVDRVLDRETQWFEQSADRTLIPASDPLDLGTIELRSNRITRESFSYFTYSKRPHFAFFRNHDLELYGRRSDPDQCDLKVYQDLLVYTFIKDNLPPGSKILEVGGGDSRVLRALRASYECWNLDKLEGAGNGLTTVDATGYRLVKDYLGEFSKELPEGYFDFVFSISVFEHLDETRESFRNVCLDLDRVMKPQALSLHCLNVVQGRNVWANQVLPFLFEHIRTANRFIPLDQLKLDPHTFYMSEAAYNQGWKNITQKSYGEVGRLLSYNCLWQKRPGIFQPG